MTTNTTRQQRRSDPWAARKIIDCRCGKRHYEGWTGCPRSKGYLRPATKPKRGLGLRITRKALPAFNAAATKIARLRCKHGSVFPYPWSKVVDHCTKCSGEVARLTPHPSLKAALKAGAKR